MRRCLLAALACVGLTGCPADPIEGVDAGPPDGFLDGPDGRMGDAGADAVPPDAMAPDAMAPDTAVDAMAPDTAVDAMAPDAAVDAMAPDAAVDAMPPDTAVDAMPDAAVDAMPDAAVDAMPDAMPPDAMPDAADQSVIPIWDAAVDATPDATPDLAVDAEPDAGPLDGPARSDDFERGPLGRFWQLFNPQLFDVAVEDGALWMTPMGPGLWFDRSTGPLIHQPVTGDFRVTARVRARRRTAPAEPPAELVHVGGLMARDPQSPPEDYVFVVVGRDVDDLSVETKTTVGGRSAFTGPAWPGGGDAELRICRLGPDFRLYKRPIDGGEWQLAEHFERDDLPPTLAVGAIAYTNSREPDLTVGFEEITFEFVEGLGDCTAD